MAFQSKALIFWSGIENQLQCRVQAMNFYRELIYSWDNQGAGSSWIGVPAPDFLKLTLICGEGK
jgi:hypothetical protein